MKTFNDFGLAAGLVRAVAAKGYEAPTPIQARAMPPLLEGRDLLGIAQTGTGKTAAFALPILNALIGERRAPTPRRPRVLVLAPTRELVSQIAESFRVYGAGEGLHCATVYGGVKQGPQVRALDRGVDVLVAAPGRLLDLMGQGHVDLGGVERFVLDEADQMLDLGFLPSIRKIVARLPKSRQNLFFSATMPAEVRRLAADLLQDPAEVSVAPPATTVQTVLQSVVFVEAARKKVLLAELYEDRALRRTIVFTRTKRGADRVARHLELCGVEAAAIHGDKSQPQREKALAAFKAGGLRALVATDIAARGIDVAEVSHVLNFELPNVPESYVHRIGRTARAGAAGVAVSLVSDEERPLLKDIERSIRRALPTSDRRRDPALGAAEAAERRLNPQPPVKSSPAATRGKPGAGGGPRRRRRPAASGRPFGGREARAQPK